MNLLSFMNEDQEFRKSIYSLMRTILFFSIILLYFCLVRCKKGPNDHGKIPDPCLRFACESGAITRGDTTEKTIAVVFTGDEFADGGQHIISVLKTNKIQASFFFTGNFYRDPGFRSITGSLISGGHYLGAHSDRHLLYCDWNNRDSLLVTKEAFILDLEDNYDVMGQFGISKKDAPYFLPPYEWYNDSISEWTEQMGLQLINFTPGTLSNADYTTPDMQNYRSSEVIYRSILDFEKENKSGLNGFILLIHIGTAPIRTDKFYLYLDSLVIELKSRGYQMVRIDELLFLQDR